MHAQPRCADCSVKLRAVPRAKLLSAAPAAAFQWLLRKPMCDAKSDHLGRTCSLPHTSVSATLRAQHRCADSSVKLRAVLRAKLHSAVLLLSAVALC